MSEFQTIPAREVQIGEHVWIARKLVLPTMVVTSKSGQTTIVGGGSTFILAADAPVIPYYKR